MSSGSVSPSTSVEPGFTMPAFSVAMSSRVGPRYSTWSTLDVGHDRDRAVDDVGRVPGAAETDLDDGGLDGHIGEVAERRGREDLEVARRLGEELLDHRDRLRASPSSVVVGDRLARSQSDPLVHALRCGLVYDAGRQSGARRAARRDMRATDVLPFVPVRWTIGYSSCGRARAARSGRRMRSSVGAPPRRSAPSRHAEPSRG